MGKLEIMMPHKKKYVVVYLVFTLIATGFCFTFIGKDLLPHTNSGQFQIRIKAPEGTRLERTEEKLHSVLQIIDSTVEHHVSVSSAYVGLVPSSFGTSNLYVFNSGVHEAVLQVNLNEDYKVNMDDLKDALRKNISAILPDLKISFEPIDLTEKIMSEGASTPIEVRVAGKNIKEIEKTANLITDSLKKIPYLRDIQIAQPLHFPTINIKIDRFKAAQFGLTVKDIANSITASTTSSRYTEKNMWLDEKTSYTYQMQVQIPEYIMNTLEELKEIPVQKGKSRPILSDVADFSTSTAPGEFDRVGPRRYVTVSANIYKKDLGTATTDVKKVLTRLGPLPKGLITEVKGTSNLLIETLSSLQNGLLFAILVIFLLLAANYESFKISLVVLITIPAVILGSLLMLLITGNTLNLQSYMGMIMSTGVSVANAILIVTNAESLRLNLRNAENASVMAAGIRLRPILMTSLAMIAGMIPMAMGIGEAGEQSAPLGRAVIGGLLASMFAALFILPQAFAWVQSKTDFESNSLMPEG